MENYTQIPNEILDEWMKLMTPSAFMVLMVICRKTLGWQKDVDKICFLQIEELTGLSRHTIIRALKELKDKDLIITDLRQGKLGSYELNLTSADLEQVNNGTSADLATTCAESAPELVQKVHIQKKDKETNTKNNLYQWLIDMFYVSYSLKYNEKLIINSKEGKQVKNILELARKINADDPKEIILKKFNLLKESDFFQLTPGILLSQWNNLVPKTKREFQPNYNKPPERIIHRNGKDYNEKGEEIKI